LFVKFKVDSVGVEFRWQHETPTAGGKRNEKWRCLWWWIRSHLVEGIA